MDKFELMMLEAQIDAVFMEAIARHVLSLPKTRRIPLFRPANT